MPCRSALGSHRRQGSTATENAGGHHALLAMPDAARDWYAARQERRQQDGREGKRSGDEVAARKLHTDVPTASPPRRQRRAARRPKNVRLTAKGSYATLSRRRRYGAATCRPKSVFHSSGLNIDAPLRQAPFFGGHCKDKPFFSDSQISKSIY